MVAVWCSVVCMDVHMRKKRNVRSVIGWLLSFQLSDPAAGVCWAVSIFAVEFCGGVEAGDQGVNAELHVAFAQERARRRVGVYGKGALGAGSSFLPRTS
jgi:hypothetical protein